MSAGALRRGPLVRAGLLLVGHGTRSEAGAEECRLLAQRVRALRPDLAVAAGNLELAEPLISEGMDDLRAAGASEVTAVPLLLGSARHDKHDIPAALAREERRRPGLAVRYAAPLGPSDELLDLVAERVRGASAAPPEATAVVLARAGSTDPDAWEAVSAAARRLAARGGFRAVEPAFAGVAEPGVDEALSRCRRSGAEHIVAAPYLLFAGALVARIRQRAEALSRARVTTAAHLGPDERLARLALARFDQAARAPRPLAPA